MSNKLLSKIKINKVGLLQNRVVMSAMTRGFADTNHCATSNILDYYERRAKNNVGLIITEGIIIHPSADGYNNVPHLFTDEQMLSWKKVVDAVHKYETKIYAQLWHCGRISHPDYTGGTSPISSSIFITASFAPPCAGPHNDAIPEAIQAKGLAPDDPASLTVEVEAFCS